MKKFIFERRHSLELAINSKKEIFNFLNMHSLYLFKKNALFREAVCFDRCKNFPDGNMIAKKLGIKKQRGPDFTRKFLLEDFAKEKRHFFIGLEEREINTLSKIAGISEKNIGAYNPPFIKKIEFSEEERGKMIKKINSFNTDYLWICIGNPKQEILSYQLFNQIKVKKIFNIGAALDFILERKKEAPKIWQKLGFEWMYLGITNPKRTLKKIKMSFIALKYLDKGVKLE
jgi:exopolysaccharide biosynthesis WecB/TagA/CpsF family protein